MDDSDFYESESGTQPPEDGPVVPQKRGRGRPPGSGKKRINAATDPEKAAKQQAQQIPLDENGHPYEIANDELVLPVDPAGETKVDQMGKLQGNREYRVRTFTLKDRGERLYMLSTEPARAMGFRDSYLLFQKHRCLWKVILTDQEKFELIERDLMPHSYKGRVIGIVTARSVFREFGARILVGGHRVTDDYYEAKAVEEGHTPEELADPLDVLPPPGEPYNKNQYVAWYGASQVYHPAGNVVAVGKELLSLQRRDGGAGQDALTVDWMYKSALAVSKFNSELRARRQRLLSTHGVYEPHTGLAFRAGITQPTRAVLSRTATDGPKVERSTVIQSRRRVVLTGLSDVPPELYSALDSETQRAVALQTETENL